MKILFISEGLQGGGKERQIVSLLKGLQLINTEFHCELVLLNKDVHYKEIFDLSLKIHFLTDNNMFVFFRKLINICKTFKPDILHSWGFKPTRYSLPFAKLFHVKLINGTIRYATPVKKYSTLWFSGRILFPISDVVVANSKAGLAAHNLKLSNKYKVIYNGFNFDRMNNLISKNDFKKEQNINTKYIVGMVANFTPAKDYITYLNAAFKILEKRTDVTFLCVGSGNTITEHINLIPQKFKGFIVYTGYTDKIENIVNALDIGVLCTNTNGFAEGNSNAIIEYMASGKPVIATKCGGNLEIIMDNVTGYLIDAFKPEELAKKINYLLDHLDVANDLGENGKKRIIEHFCLDSMIENYTMIYKKLYNQSTKDFIFFS